jgi:hypothetical protein
MMSDDQSDQLEEQPKKRKPMSDEVRAKISASRHAQWKDPEYRAKVIAAQKQGQKNCWSDPIKRQLRMARNRATILKKFDHPGTLDAVLRLQALEDKYDKKK